MKYLFSDLTVRNVAKVAPFTEMSELFYANVKNRKLRTTSINMNSSPDSDEFRDFDKFHYQRFIIVSQRVSLGYSRFLSNSDFTDEEQAKFEDGGSLFVPKDDLLERMKNPYLGSEEVYSGLEFDDGFKVNVCLNSKSENDVVSRKLSARIFNYNNENPNNEAFLGSISNGLGVVYKVLHESNGVFLVSSQNHEFAIGEKTDNEIMSFLFDMALKHKK